MDILDLARRNQQKARKIIEDTKIIPIWESIGARVNLVGSLSTGLLMIPSGKIKNIHCFSFVMTCKCRKKDGYIAINNYLIT